MNRLDTGDWSSKLRGVIRGIGNGLSAPVKRRLNMVLAAILLLAVVHGVASFVIGRKVDAEIAKIRAKGEPASPADLGLPKVPDDQNAALIYAKAFKIMERRDASSALKTLMSVRDRQSEPESLNKIRQAVDRFNGVMPLLEQAISRPKCQFPVDWGDYFASFSHVSGLLRLQSLLSAESMLAVHDHNTEAALQSVRMEFQLSESLSEEPAIVSQLVRSSLIERACESLHYCLQYGAIDQLQAQQLAATLAEFDLVPGLVKALKGWRIEMGLTGFRYFGKHPVDFCNTSAHESTPWGGAVWATVEASFPARPFLNADQLVFFRAMEQVIAVSGLPYREFTIKRDARLPWYAAASTMSVPAGRSLAARDRAVANLALAQVALALSVYRTQYGEYPANLHGLEARLKWRLPEDPFAGKQLNYKRQGKGFLLYSIGPDLTDNGGQKIANSDNWGYYWAPGDIVWKTQSQNREL